MSLMLYVRLFSGSLNIAQHANSSNRCGQCAEFGSTAKAAQSLYSYTVTQLVFSG